MSEKKKTRVGVIFGGRSGEHEVSLRSAESIIRSLDPSKYDVVPLAITHEGHWLTAASAVAMLPAGKAIEAVLKEGKPMTLAPEPVPNGVVDVFFPIVHGTYGEDGTLQGLLELAGVAYVGAGVLGSAVGMDKEVMKRLLREAGLPVGDYWVTRGKDVDAFARQIGPDLPYPVFVETCKSRILCRNFEGPRYRGIARCPRSRCAVRSEDRCGKGNRSARNRTQRAW